MDGLARLVADSLARHGFETPLDYRRLQWSRWFRCESSFSFLLVPGEPGLFAMGEEMVAPGEVPATGGKRMLAIFQIAEAADLSMAMARLFAPNSPLRQRFAEGRCFARYVVIEDDVQRRTALAALHKWLASAVESASGIPADFFHLGEPSQNTSVETNQTRDIREDSTPAVSPLTEPESRAPFPGKRQSENVCERSRSVETPRREKIMQPAPLPAGF